MQIQGLGSTPTPSQAAAPGQTAELHLEEMRVALKQSEDSYARYDELQDEARGHDLSVSFRRGSGGCGEPAVHEYVVKSADEELTVPVEARVLDSPSVLSVDGGGRVVGSFWARREGEAPSARDVEKAVEKGVLAPGEQFSGYYLAEVPTPRSILSTFPNYLRRKGMIGPKVMTWLPEGATSFDLGPKRTVAIADDKRVLRWTPRRGLEPWLEFDRDVQRVEFLRDGGLAVSLQHPDLSGALDGAYVAPGSSTPVEVPFKALFPEQYENKLSSRVQSVEFLRGAPVAEMEGFLERCDWLEEGGYWKPHRSQESPDGTRAAVAVRGKEGDWQLHVYDHSKAEARPLGPLSMGAPEPEESRGWGSSRPGMRWSQDGLHVLHSTSPKEQGAPVDLTVWDVGAGTSALVPFVRDLQLEGNEISFVSVEGETLRVPLADVPKLVEQPWYRKALTHELLDAEAPAAEVGTIEQKGDQVQVGELLLPVRQR